MNFITKTYLKRSSHETCDFCEKTFNNKYDSIVHNVSHIIIPLINIKLPLCVICGDFFTSEDDYLDHISNAHSNALENVAIPSKEEPAINIKHEKEQVSLQKRILFENDNDDIHLLSKFTTDCKVNVECFDPLHYQAAIAIENFITIDDDLMIDALGKKINEWNDFQNIETSFSRRCEIRDNMLVFRPRGFSFSYDSLKKPGIFKCQHCNKLFPDRFTAIKHEASHIKFLKVQPQLCLFCDKYVAGSSEMLTKHILKYHPHKRLKNYCKSICQKCGYHYRKYNHHVKYYHHLECYICYEQFRSGSDLAQHLTIHCQQESTFQVCDLCLRFYKPKKYKYEVVGQINVPGERQTCSSCGRMFFGVFLVKRKNVKICLTYGDMDKRKPITNMQRLKNIQQRLKKMKF